ncbi:DUF6777 domain-containing protein [Streptomyces antimicrobicus]|uniref:Primosomal protein n=1 Tax=Streptomyces antimicrobicus TaxID=2883108 RepID=A0ABS8BBG7_9ACTN|nr:DUF6777 domain-containing protein [Streptomyces antimicrobicus]MCB5181977.1 primosomal protein [Streptomyces antimicrobicus]
MSASTAVVMATAVVLAFTVMSGNEASGGEVFLQSTAAAGPDPFTPSTATESDPPEVTNAAAPGTGKGGSSGARTLQVNGAHPGLYGGTRNVASCDVEKQIKYLTEHKDKGAAFAAPLKIGQPEIPSYLRSLTPVRLGWDTRVTNHGYKDAAPTSYQAVLQAGTAVMVDDRGVPRVRCACGNPLTPPVAVKGNQTYNGTQWSSFQSSELVAVRPAEEPVKGVTMYDHHRKDWYERPSGDAQGKHDHEVPPPKGHEPDAPPALPPADPGSGEKHQDKGRQPDKDKPPVKDPGKEPDKAPVKEPGKEPDKPPVKEPEKPAQEPDKQVKEPGKEQDKAPDSGTDKAPGTGTDKAPDSGTDKAPGTGTDKAPDTGTEKAPDTGTEKAPGTGTDKAPDTGTDKAPGTGTDKAPDTGTEKAPGTGTEKAPDTGTEKAPGTGTDKAPDTGTEKAPGTGTEKAPDTGTEKAPGTGTDKAPGTGTDKAPGTGTDKGSGDGAGTGTGTGNDSGGGSGNDSGQQGQ